MQGVVANLAGVRLAGSGDGEGETSIPLIAAVGVENIAPLVLAKLSLAEVGAPSAGLSSLC